MPGLQTSSSASPWPRAACRRRRDACYPGTRPWIAAECRDCRRPRLPLLGHGCLPSLARRPLSRLATLDRRGTPGLQTSSSATSWPRLPAVAGETPAIPARDPGSPPNAGIADVLVCLSLATAACRRRRDARYPGARPWIAAERRDCRRPRLPLLGHGPPAVAGETPAIPARSSFGRKSGPCRRQAAFGACPARTSAEAGLRLSTMPVGIRIVAPRSLVVS